MKLRFKNFYKDHFSWQDSEFIRNVRSHPDTNKILFESKKITRVEQEYWYNNEYCKNENYMIWIAYDEERKCPIAYTQFFVESYVHRRIKFNYVISPEFYYFLQDFL